MSRPQKEGLDYFPVDCGFFGNAKIKSLRRAFGEIGIATYLNVLCKVYTNGYFLKIKSIDDIAYDIAEEIANTQLSKVACRVTRCILYMADIGLLDKRCLDVGVITSRAMQEQYITSLAKCKRKAIVKEYALMSYPFDEQKKVVNTEETLVNMEETPVNTELMPQRKGNESKVNESIERGTPTLEEISNYCKERKNNVDPKRFLDYFTASGWVDSKGNKVQNWKQKVIAWERTEFSKPDKPENSNNILTKDFNAEELNAAFDNLNKEL